MCTITKNKTSLFFDFCFCSLFLFLVMKSISFENGSKTFALYNQPYLDTYQQCYLNIVTVNVVPQGPLKRIVRKVQLPPLSVFKEPGPCSRTALCGLALTSWTGCSGLMLVDEVPELFNFLLMNEYTIDTSITKMMNMSDTRFQTNNANKLICFVTYKGSE